MLHLGRLSVLALALAVSAADGDRAAERSSAAAEIYEDVERLISDGTMIVYYDCVFGAVEIADPIAQRRAASLRSREGVDPCLRSSCTTFPDATAR